MKKLLLAVVVSIAVCSIPAFAHHPAEDNDNLDDDTWEMIDENLDDMDSPHLDLDLSLMGGTLSVNDMSSDDPMNQPTEADLDRIQAGDQTSDGVENEAGDAGEENEPADSGASEENHEGSYVYEETIYRPAAVVAVDEELEPEQTETKFRSEVTTPSPKNEEGMVELYEKDAVKVASKLSVDDADVGKTVQCLVMAQYKADEDDEGTIFMLAEKGWQPWYGWNGSPGRFPGKACRLEKNHEITAYEGELFTGVFNFAFAYQFNNGGVVAGPKVLSFTVK